MNQYDHTKIEKKWQKVWESKKPNKVREDLKKKKFYGLIEFPYPSGSGLHVGHIRSNTAMDIICRKRRREGYNVLYPIGWDAFGLPTENYAIKTGIQPSVVTKTNTDIFRKQLKALGFSFDWSREINTTDPKYYKWTQWIFLQFLKNGLAYKKKMTINWCPKDLIGLANEEVVNGKCDRCGTVVEKREKEQWMLAITKYAERLDKDLDETDFLEKIKIQQRNWIGKSEGINFIQKIKGSNIKFEVYDSVPQTFLAQTFTVIAPDHKLIPELVKGTEKEKEVLDFVKRIAEKKRANKFDIENDMEGIFTGRYVENPFGTGDLPLWIASYVVVDYGTGIVNCSAHDERDFAFAKKYNIPLKEVAEALFVKTDGEDALKVGAPIVEREAITAIVKHWSENKYIGLKWKKVDWDTFITGGVEKGQTPEEAARAEILEETGYKNLKLIKVLPKTHSKFFHVPKNENRFAHFNVFYFQLINDEKQEIVSNEIAKHGVVWLTADEMKSFRLPDSHRLAWEQSQGIEKPIVKNGILTEPVEFKGREWSEVRNDVIDYIVKKGYGKKTVQFKLRDWVFSRQRYWGEPIPVVHCEKCGIVPVPEKELPIKLPKVKNYAPTENGESPLAGIEKWVNTKCPNCKGKAKRETDTMPNWAGSSWYYLRYTDAKNNKAFADKKNLKYWTPVDWYNGGMEHTTLHLLYSRFWHKFLFDLGFVPTSEPYKKRTSHGMILAEGGEKMSKSKGNVINPDEIVKTVGADSLRIHEMFMGPFDQAIAWDQNTIAGSRRFIERVWKLQEKLVSGNVSASENVLSTGSATKTETLSLRGHSESLSILIHKTIKKVSENIEEMKFNTAISSLMILLNEFEKEEKIAKQQYEILIKLLAPFAPHVTEELWSILKNKKSVHSTEWPIFDPKMLVENNIRIMIQVNGKVRGIIETKQEMSEGEVKDMALGMPEVAKWIEGKEIKKVIFVKGKLISFVI